MRSSTRVCAEAAAGAGNSCVRTSLGQPDVALQLSILEGLPPILRVPKFALVWSVSFGS
jgi:hypothetical protein